jgi:serine/threonine protein kinase
VVFARCLRQCPFVVRFEGAVVQGPNMYILMEVLDGGNLQEFIRNNHVTEQVSTLNASSTHTISLLKSQVHKIFKGRENVK